MRSNRLVFAASSLLLFAACVGGTSDPPDNPGTQSSAATFALKPRITFPKPKSSVVDATMRSDILILKLREGTHVRVVSGKLTFDPSLVSAAESALLKRVALDAPQVTSDVAAIARIVGSDQSIAIEPYFDRDAAALEKEKWEGEKIGDEELADLSLYVRVRTPQADATTAAKLLDTLNAIASVEVAYAQPIPDDASPHDIAPVTVDLSGNQGYVTPAPTGIDAQFAWTVPGGRGAGVRLVDVETGWNTDHEDLPDFFTFGGWNWGSGDHGTAVMGILAAPNNGYGITGIASDMAVGASSPVPIWDPAGAINLAAANAGPGNIVQIEQHYPGPAGGAVCGSCGNCGQFGYAPVELYQAEFDVIRAATARGIIVVEAAGNGTMNLDGPQYGGRFNRRLRDSGAIMVGAGIPHTHATECWSNAGSRVDVQGWGEQVMTLGYGDLRINGDDQRQFYTQGFSGTSSATPIVSGAVADIQGVRTAAGLSRLPPFAMRNVLVVTGTAPPPGERHIGPLPDLRAAITSFRPADAGAEVDVILSRFNYHTTGFNLFNHDPVFHTPIGADTSGAVTLRCVPPSNPALSATVSQLLGCFDGAGYWATVACSTASGRAALAGDAQIVINGSCTVPSSPTESFRVLYDLSPSGNSWADFDVCHAGSNIGDVNPCSRNEIAGQMTIANVPH